MIPVRMAAKMTKKPTGIGLLSGGLDSALACLVTRDAGADVRCIHFFTGFCVTGHNSRVGRMDRPIANHALQVAAEMGVPLELVDISEEYLPMVLEPKHGYGRNMNPCIDCRVFMLRKARERMERTGADFVFTGEVVGQRPKSQVKTALGAIEKEAGLEGRLLRPLSAKKLPATVVEREGRIDRQKLYGLSGRGRKPQLELARRYGITTYAQPAGGCCFLTDEAYSNKFKDAISHGSAGRLSVDDVVVLGVGRHFRFSPVLKLIVGRNAAENHFLAHIKGDRWLAGVVGFTGPTALVQGEIGENDWVKIASIVARYSDGKSEDAIEVEFIRGSMSRRVNAAPAAADFVAALRI
jgi:tRNA U34 2-thiouridine synthase MnmA/TrmU